MAKSKKIKSRSPETLALLVSHRGGTHKSKKAYTRKDKHKGRGYE